MIRCVGGLSVNDISEAYLLGSMEIVVTYSNTMSKRNDERWMIYHPIRVWLVGVLCEGSESCTVIST